MSRRNVELTVASFVKDGSFATGPFCFARFPKFTIGPEFLLRALSVEDQPGLPSSPPVLKWKPKMTFSSTLGCTKLESYGTALMRNPGMGYKKLRGEDGGEKIENGETNNNNKKKSDRNEIKYPTSTLYSCKRHDMFH